MKYLVKFFVVTFFSAYLVHILIAEQKSCSILDMKICIKRK